MIRRLLPMLLLLLTACVSDPDEEWSLQPGEQLPDFAITMADGTEVTSQSLKGETTVIFLFNTTCPDCQAEFPRLQAAMEEHPEVRFLGIARSETDPEIADYWAAHALTLPYSPQKDAAVYHLFASSGIPRVFVVSPDLMITQAYFPE